jgi:hypothetical protein
MALQFVSVAGEKNSQKRNFFKGLRMGLTLFPGIDDVYIVWCESDSHV